jgi:hypothetical protein
MYYHWIILVVLCSTSMYHITYTRANEYSILHITTCTITYVYVLAMYFTSVMVLHRYVFILQAIHVVLQYNHVFSIETPYRV